MKSDKKRFYGLSLNQMHDVIGRVVLKPVDIKMVESNYTNAASLYCASGTAITNATGTYITSTACGPSYEPDSTTWMFGPDKSGWWWYTPPAVTTTEKPMIKELTSALKRLVSPSTQKQYKAGLRNGELMLTEKGARELLEILAAEHEEKLTKVAEEIITESEAQKK